MNSYSFKAVNIKKSKRPTWRFTKVEENFETIRTYGKLFCFAELTRSDDVKVECIKSLIQSIFTNYVNGAAEETSSDPSDIFEYLLEEANKKFTDITLNADNGSFSDLAIVVGMIWNGNVMISHYGKVEAWILHTTEDNKVRFINILKSQQGKTKDVNKLFDQIISGSLANEQPLLISSSNVWQYFTQDKLKKIIKDNPDTIDTLLTDMINALPGTPDICIMVGHAEETNEGENASSKKSDASTEGKEDTLIKAPDQVNESGDNEPQQSDTTDEDRFAQKEENEQKEKTEHEVFKPVGYKGSALRPSPLRQEVRQPLQKTHTERYLHSTEKKTAAFTTWMKRLPVKTKWVLIVGVILVIVFIQTVAVRYNGWSGVGDNGAVNEVMRDIRLKQEEAQAKLIYNDRSEARRLIEEALTLAENLPEKGTNNENDRSFVVGELQGDLDEINNVNSVSLLLPFATTELSPADKVFGAFIKNSYAGFISSEKKIFFIHTDNGSVFATTIENVPTDITSATWDEEFEIIYLHDADNALYSIDISTLDPASAQTIGAEKISADTSGIETEGALAFYAGRLYLTDSGSIKRIELSNNTVTDWLNAGVSIPSDVRDIAIDSTIYLLTDTDVMQYFRGNKTDWKLGSIDPVAGRFIQIQASFEDDSNIYLLEGTAKRIIVLTKDGKSERQLFHNGWDNLKGFVIHTDRTTAYVMNGPDVYRIPLD